MFYILDYFRIALFVSLFTYLYEKIKIDQNELIESFQSYERQYKSLLGEYIKPDADLNVLVKKITVLARKLKPISFDKIWVEKEKINVQ